MHGHTHDGIDWVHRLADLRQADEANAPALQAVARRLVESLPPGPPTVIDIGSGAGGMSAALAAALATAPRGRAAQATPGTTAAVTTPATHAASATPRPVSEIGRASCRERV